MDNIIQISKQDCTGCKMCQDICPQGAISFKEDIDGFWYPFIDNNSCSQCGICLTRCPSVNYTLKNDNYNPLVYSLWSNNDQVRISSTSGGAFWEFAKQIIDNGGVVVGAIYGDDWKSAKHVIAKTVEELDRLKGSKYFQSDTEGIYRQVKTLLDNGTAVLFCGTPCQCAALNAFLHKEYVNLFTMDFICRSINSPKAFRSYIEELESLYDSSVVGVHLKDKENGWHSLASRVTFKNGKTSLKDKESDYWVKGFIYNDLYTRESCFHCKYKVIPRSSSDLTIGDFWGIKDQKDEDLFKGISVLLVNSNKGKELFEKVYKQFTFCEHVLEDVLPGNPALLTNPKKNSKQDLFVKEINSGTSFSKAVQKCIDSEKDTIIIRSIKKVCRKIKKAKEIFIDSDISKVKFIYYNYFCKHIERLDKAKILPHKNAIINFDKNAKIILSGKNLEIGFNKLKGSRSETHLRLNENAIWRCKNGALLFYDTVLEIKPNAEFESGFFSMNGGSVIIIHKKVTFGEDVMLGRNIIIYDSDFHSLYNTNYKRINVPKPVRIEDHVWLTTNVMVQKGVTIGKDSLIAAYTVVNKDVPPHSIVGGKASAEIIKDWVHWERQTCPLSMDE